MSEAAINLDQFDTNTCGDAPPPVRVLPGTYSVVYRDYVVNKLESGSAKSQLMFEIVEVGEVTNAPDGVFTLDYIGGEESLVGKRVYSEPVWFTSQNADYVASATKRQAAILGFDYDTEVKGKSPREISELYSSVINDEFNIKVTWDVQKMNGEVRTDDDGNPRFDIVARKG